MSHSILSFCKLCTNLQYSFLMFLAAVLFALQHRSVLLLKILGIGFSVLTASILIVPAYHMTAYSGL